MIEIDHPRVASLATAAKGGAVTPDTFEQTVNAGFTWTPQPVGGTCPQTWPDAHKGGAVGGIMMQIQGGKFVPQFTEPGKPWICFSPDPNVPLPKDPQPTWLGYSIGRWEGDTLVVEATGFNGRAWIDTGSGHPITDVGRVTERFTRRDFGHMDIDITIDDAKAYLKPWRAKIPSNLLPDSDLIETFCENERDIRLMDRARKAVDGAAR